MSVTRQWRIRAATFVAATVFASGIALPAVAATADPRTSSIAQAENPKTPVSETTDFVIAPTSQVFADTARGIELRVLLRNSGQRSLPEGSVEVLLEPRTSDAAIPVRPAAEDGAEPEATVIATETVVATEAAAEQVVTIQVPADQFPLTSTSDPGVYTITANYLPADGSLDEPLTTTTPIVWQGANPSATPVKLSLVVPFVLPSDITTMPTRTQLRELAPGFTDLLDFASTANAMLAIDPRLIAAIRGYGTEAPENARALLDRLESSSLESFVLQYGDADISAQAALDLPELLGPANLDFVTRYGKFEAQTPATEDTPTPEPDAPAGVDASEGASPAAVTDPDQPAAPDDTADSADPADPAAAIPPTLDELGAWENGRPGSWPSQVTNHTLNYQSRFGLTFTVLNSQNAVLTGGPRATLGSGDAVVTDAELDAAVRLALAGDSEVERELGRARTSALLADAAESGSTGLALGVDRGAIIQSENPVDVLTSLLSETWVRTVALGAQPEGSAVLNAQTIDADRTGLLDTALDNESNVLQVRAMLEHPEYLDGYQRMRLLTLFSTRYAAADVNFESVAKRFAKRDADILDGVNIVVSKHAQLVGASSRIPVQLRNSLPFDVVSEVTVTPTSAALAVEQRVFHDVRVADDSSDRVLVPVLSRVSSGESGLIISVTSTDGEFTAATAVFPISISTSVETIALVVLALAAVLLFGFGIWRSVRRRRTGIARI